MTRLDTTRDATRVTDGLGLLDVVVHGILPCLWARYLPRVGLGVWSVLVVEPVVIEVVEGHRHGVELQRGEGLGVIRLGGDR